MQYRRSEEKNDELVKRYDIWFEDIEEAIAGGGLLDGIPHYNPVKYPSQRIYIVYMREYIYAVPFVYKSQWCVFLKTIIPQREFKKKYIENL